MSEDLIARVTGVIADTQRIPRESVTIDKTFEELKIDSLDGFIVIAAEYNRGPTAVLKNALDYAYKEWNKKPVAVMGATVGTFGTARAQYHLRQMFVFLNMYAVAQPEVMIPQAHKLFDDQGNLNDEGVKKLIARLLEELVSLTRQLSK